MLLISVSNCVVLSINSQSNSYFQYPALPKPIGLYQLNEASLRSIISGDNGLIIHNIELTTGPDGKYYFIIFRLYAFIDKSMNISSIPYFFQFLWVPSFKLLRDYNSGISSLPPTPVSETEAFSKTLSK